MIPERFRGVWQRVSLSVDGGAWCEPAQVVWVQTGAIFGDIRLPFDGRSDEHPEMSFAGTLTWSDPCLTWVHKLDLFDDGGHDDTVDTASVSWHGDELVCSGQFPRESGPVPYTEVWRRLAGSHEPALSLVRADGHGVLVQAGDHAITIADDRARGGDYRACYRSRTPGGWAVTLSIGARPDSLPAPPDVSDQCEAMVLDGRRWHVLERSPSPARSSSDPSSAGRMPAGHSMSAGRTSSRITSSEQPAGERTPAHSRRSLASAQP